MNALKRAIVTDSALRRTLAIVSLRRLFAAGCSWVKTTPGGEQVRRSNGGRRRRMSGSRHRVGHHASNAAGIPRNKDVIREEQVTLARNQAAQIGGDTIVQSGAPSGGTLTFTVYRCMIESEDAATHHRNSSGRGARGSLRASPATFAAARKRHPPLRDVVRDGDTQALRESARATRSYSS